MDYHERHTRFKYNYRFDENARNSDRKYNFE